MLGEDINKQMSSQKALVSSGWPAETLVGMKRDVALRSEEEDKPSENGKDGNCSARAERSTATDFLLMSPPGLRPDRSPQNWFSRLPTTFLLLQSRVQVCVYMVKTSQIPDDITLKCTTSTTIANRPGCFQSTWKLHFSRFSTSTNMQRAAQICSLHICAARCCCIFVSSSEPQAFQNIEPCFTKSRYEAGGPACSGRSAITRQPDNVSWSCHGNGP